MNAPLDGLPAMVVVHGTAELRLAIDAARAVRIDRLGLLSARSAACFLGPAWWRALMVIAEGLATGGPALVDVLDCGESAGRAMEALRLGQRRLVLGSPGDRQAGTVAERAVPLGAVILGVRPVALDLADPSAARGLVGWLEGAGEGRAPPGPAKGQSPF